MGVFRAVVDLDFAAGGTSGVNVWHLRDSGVDGNDGEIVDLMDSLKAFYQALASKLPPTYKWSWNGDATEVGVEDPRFKGAIGGWTVSGTAGEAGYGPSPVGACVTWRSSSATRSGRGRTFISPLGASCFDGDGSLLGTVLTQFRAAATAFIADFDGLGNGAFGVWSVKDNVLRDFVTATVTDQAAVLKSRRQ